jgi:V/A-type H+-transporting ATPase subunit B
MMESLQLFTRETKAISTARRSLLIIESIPGIRYNEIVDVQLGTGEMRSGQVIEVGKKMTVVQVVGGVSEVDLLKSKVRYKGETLKLPVSIDILGKIFDGSGSPIDGNLLL